MIGREGSAGAESVGGALLRDWYTGGKRVSKLKLRAGAATLRSGRTLGLLELNFFSDQRFPKNVCKNFDHVFNIDELYLIFKFGRHIL